MRLKGKVALVTGATRGCGRSIAEIFAAEGAKVVLGGRTVERGHKNVQIIRDAGGEAMFVPLDVTDEESAKAAVAATVEAYGPITTLVNNAAPTQLITKTFKPTADLSLADWNQILHGTLTSAFFMAKYAIPHMLAGGGGSIINISSGGSSTGVRNLSAYNAGKAGINSLTRSIAIEYGEHGIRCNTIIVGRVISYQVDRERRPGKEMLMRPGGPRDIGNAALYLASDEADWVTGSELTADGGARFNGSSG